MRRLFSLIELMKQQKGDAHGNRSADSGRHLGERHKLKPFSGAQDRDVAGAALEWQALITAVSIGYRFSHFPVRKPTTIIVTTIDKMVMMLLIVNAAISLSHGVIETPIANKSG